MAADAKFQPDWFSKPGDTLASLLAERDIAAPEFAQRIGRDLAFVRGLLAGTARVDAKTAQRLSDAVGGTPQFWISRQVRFEEGVGRAARAMPSDVARSWIQTLPLKEMAQAGWIAEPASRTEAIETSLAFFDVGDPEEWKERYTTFQNEFSFRTSPTYPSKLGSLAAWLRQGEIESQSLKCASWRKCEFRSRLRDIRVLTKAKAPSYFIPRLRSMCAEAGVAVVFLRAPAGCRVSGATRYRADGRAIILLSFRYLSDDHFWFTFFHEAGHLLLHGPTATFIDGDASAETKRERDANAFSASVLIPPHRQDDLMSLRPRALNVIRFALSLGVSPGIVVGQMQHLGLIGMRQLNHLKRRYTWEEIQKACAD